jgi:hypothetical protein
LRLFQWRLGDWASGVEHYRQVVAASQFSANGIKDTLPIRSKSAEDHYNLRCDGVDDGPKPFVVQQQIDELGELKTVNGSN